MKNRFRIVGKTEEGQPVVAGCFMMHDTEGMPLPITFTLLSAKGWVPSPIHFYENARKAGWSDKTIFDRLEEAYLDGYNLKFWKEVEGRMYHYLQNRDEFIPDEFK